MKRLQQNRSLVNIRPLPLLSTCVIPSQCESYRDTIFEGDPLQGVAVCNPMLNEFLPQRGRDAGGAAVRADLSPGQTLGQFAL